MSEVLIIQHQAMEGPGTIEEEIVKAGHKVRKVRIDQGDQVPNEVGGMSGLVVMGGSMGVGDQGKLSHLKDEIALLKQFHKAEKPILGICLGRSYWRRRWVPKWWREKRRLAGFLFENFQMRSRILFYAGSRKTFQL